MRKFLLNLRLALFWLLLFGNAPHVFADYFVDQGIAYYTTSNNTVAVTSNGASPYSGSITIPQTVTHIVHSGYENFKITFTVTSIEGSAFYDCAGLQSVSIPNTVISIGDQAFYGCSNLKSIVIPNGVQKIGRSAFQDCTGLTSVSMANSVSTIGDNLFYGCTSLNNVVLSSSINTMTNTFFGCSSLNSIVIPSSITKIDGAFTGCTSLKQVVLPNSLETIGTRCFEDCSLLTDLFIPNSVTSIGQMAFNNSGLTAIEIPFSTTEIGRDAFMNCHNLMSVTSRPFGPPAMANKGCFSNDTYDQASFYVPNFVKNTYQTTNWWNSFKNIIGKSELDNAYDRVINGIYYMITSDNSVSVTFKDNNYNSYSGNVTIPSTVNIDGKTYQVTEIGYCAFKNCSGLVSVTIPNSVTSIAGQAFINSGLTALTLPGSMEYIGPSAFNNCDEIKTLTIPESVVSIGSNAFAYCDRITSLTWNAKNCRSNGNLDARNITQVTIGNSVEVLPEYFVSNSKITQVSLPESLVAIGGYAFMGCAGLSTLTVPSHVKEIGKNAFSNTNISSLTWNAVSCYSNGNMATYNITQVTIGDGVVMLPSGFVQYSGITSITIPNSVTQISGEAFSGCSSLNNLVIPESIESIGPDAFNYCYGLTNLTWNAIDCGNTGNMTCDNVTQVSIGNKVKKIPNRFCMNSGISSFVLPATVDTICDEAFMNCHQLTRVTIPNSVTHIGSASFTWCNAVTSITVQNGNLNYDSRNDCNAIIEKSTSALLVGCKNTVIPNNIKVISYAAFAGCTGLTSVLIPNSVTSIGGSAFYGCSGLTEITIPNSVTSIGVSAFYGCSGLTEITIPNSVTSIGVSAFYGCTALKTVNFNAENCSDFNSSYHPFTDCPIDRIVFGDNLKKIPGYFAKGLTSLTEITIPNSVTSIGVSAFYGCTALMQVTLGTGITHIDSYVFYNCTHLQTLICLPLSPPSIDSYTFYGVPSTMTVYVFPSAIEAYQNANYWKNYPIEVAVFNVFDLKVNLPNGIDVAKYANMKLAITQKDGDQTLHYIINDKLSYTFANLNKNTVWDVVLTNQYGDEFGKIEDVVVGEEDAAVTFPSLKKPQTVTLKVKTPSGQDVTAQTKITWKDENGELLEQSNQIAGLPAGRKLNYSVTLPQELATAYALPADMSYTVKDGGNTIVCQLTAIAQAKLSGKVKEATSNQPIYGASISATQSFAGGNSNTLTTTTDNQGLYNLDALAAPTTLTIAAQGYISQTLDCDELMTGGNNITLPDVVLQPITGAVVNVNLTYTSAHAVGETAETQNWYNDYNNVDYEVYNKTTGHVITNISVQYPQIVLLEDVNDGDVLELTASSRKDAFMPVKTTVTIAEQRATATFNILEWGQVMAKFMKNINPKVRGSLYDAENKFVMGADYTGCTLTIDNLPDGDYKLITMGKSDFFNSIYDLDQFDNAGLNEGEDYVKHNVQVESGIISDVSINEVPFFDESKFYYTESPTSFTVNKPNIVVGNYLTFRVQVDFKEQYADKVSDVQLIIDLPESCSFIDNSVLIGASSGGYTQQGNRITVPMSMAENANVVRFCAIPIEAGNFAPSAFVKFKLNGKTITQPIGNAKFNARGLSIDMVSLTADTTIQVNGTAYHGQSVKIYDGNVLIGQTQCRVDGYWSASVDLYKPYSHPYHHIQAEIEINNGSRQGLFLKTESKIVEYDKNAILVSKVTQYNEQRGPTPYLITLDYFDPNQPSQHYSYDMYDNHRTFTYTIDFTNNSAVSNVMLYVRTAKDHWWPLTATYNAQKDLWVTAGEFGNAQDADLPVNVAVDYDYEHKTDDEDINDAMLEDFANCFDNMISEIDAAYMNAECEMISESDDCYVFSVSPNGYDTQEYYEFQILDYEQTVQQYQQRNQQQDYYSIKNDSTDIGFALNFNEDSTYTTIIWDNIEQMAFQLVILRGDDYNRNLGPKRIVPFLLGAGFSIGLEIWEYHKGMEIINDYYRDIEEEMLWMEKFNSELLDRLNALCGDGKLKIKNQEMYDFALELIYEWQEEYEDFISDLLYLVSLEQQDLLTKCILKSGVGVLTSFAGGLMSGPLKNYVTKIGGQLAENIVHGVTDFSMALLSNVIGESIINPAVDDNQKTRTNINQYWLEEGGYLRERRKEIRQWITASYSDCEEEPDDYFGNPYPGPDMTFCIDPSGFVYEGVPSNRLEGVTATCYYKETVEDMYGDMHEEVVLWDAENYGQENPLLTDQNGYYRWDVPIGMWQVKYEKAGYETTYSDWLPVPPPQLDVNIGMVQMRQPEVIKARAYTKAVEFEFDKYMLPEDLTTDNITVLNDYGNPVTGTIELLNAEVDDPNAITSIRRAPGTGLTFASKVRFNSNSRFYQYATLKVSKRVKSYAGLEMNEDYVITLPVEYEMEKIVVDSTLNLLYGDSRQLTVTVEPAMASRGKTLNVRTMSPIILSTDAESYTLDNNGQAVITVHGDLPGMGSLLYDIDGYDLSASTLVNVMMESQMTVAAPTATIASGSEVEKGTAVYLRCSTEGATIYYTLDGSCPCDNTPARKVYDGSPIIIDRTMTIKAMATAPDLYDSDVATFVYRISNGLRGDVNGDGEVNIADVNAVIGVILGTRTDEDIISRADVNSDGEVNIADVNEIIRIILGNSSGAKMNVNCDDALHLDDVQLRPGEVKTLNVTLDNATRYSALQCDIVLPAGLTLVDVTSADGSVIKTGMMNDTTTRAMTYSMGKHQFAGNGSAVITLTVRADAMLSSDSWIKLTHVVLADNQDKAWHTTDCAARVNNTTGINDLTAGNDRVWTEGRTLCIQAHQNGVARLAAINGTVHELDVESGVSRYQLEPGIYVVVLNGNSYKIAIK